ncbi:MAG: von Willebrand factor type, partial [Myxococcales bacterium]|nr:von Willebrand factor type [Myxococcales bacterium]
AGRVGFYTLEAAGAPDRLVAANLADARESNIAPQKQLLAASRELLAPEIGRVGVRRELWGYLAFAALLLALIEWWTYNRRVTV